MLFGKKRKLGREIDEISEGEKLTLTEKIEDKDLLLYLGLTNDSNPLFIQHDYASQTPYKKPIVPTVMLTGIVTSAVSKYLPGPGSKVLKQNLAFPNPAYHYATVEYRFEVVKVDKESHSIMIEVSASDEDNRTVVEGSLKVCPPFRPEPITSKTLDNF